jgi:putative drug exporter of the RND superfamily
MFAKLGSVIYRRRWLTLGLAGLFLLASAGLLVRGGTLTSGVIHDMESERAQGLIEELFGHPLDTMFVAIFQAKDLAPEDEAFQVAMQKALEPLRHDARVLSVTTPDDASPAVALGMANEKGAIAYVSLKGDFKQALGAYEGVRRELSSGVLTITCTGRIPFLHDLDKRLEHDLLKAEAISLPLALLVLLLVFRTLVAAILPVAVGGLAVIGGMGIVVAMSRFTDIAQYTINVCSLIGLGVAIDYSLFMVSRYREELASGLGYPEALARAVATAGRVIGFSGAAVAVGLSGLLFFQGSYLSAMGLGGAIVVALAVLFALTFLPALLAVLGPRIHAGRLPSLLPPGLGQGMWHGMASWVMRRPLLVLLPTLALLLWMGSPFLHLRIVASDVRVLPPSLEARRGYDILKADFPDQAAARVLVAVRFPSSPALNGERIGALFDLSRRIAAIPNVSKVESIVDGAPFNTRGEYQRFLLHPPEDYASTVEEGKKLTVGDRVVLLSTNTELAPESKEAQAIVRAIREHRQVADGELLVGGQIANDLDAGNFILSRTPPAVAFVVSVTLVVLFLLFGSLILPFKALAMNFLSITASFGALVWIFQDGHLFIHDPRPVEPALPVLLFCTLFGLSMDYEVLMLSRIKEAYDQSHDNSRAVADGLERTAGLITSAAAIMVVVFSAFSLASVVVVQAVGFGMALAVALDATLVRSLLVPATMRLFGDLNWWAPRPLLRLRRWLGFEGLHG